MSLGVESLFVATLIVWLSIFFYLLLLHLAQRELSRTAARLYDSLETLKEKLPP